MNVEFPVIQLTILTTKQIDPLSIFWKWYMDGLLFVGKIKHKNKSLQISLVIMPPPLINNHLFFDIDPIMMFAEQTKTIQITRLR